MLAIGFNFRKHRSVLRSDRHIGLNPQRLPTEARNLPADRSSRISVPAVISQRHLHQPDKIKVVYTEDLTHPPPKANASEFYPNRLPLRPLPRLALVEGGHRQPPSGHECLSRRILDVVCSYSNGTPYGPVVKSFASLDHSGSFPNLIAIADAED